MNKILVSSLVALVTLGTQVASAQSYYPSNNYNTYGATSSGTCINLVSDLSWGSRGGEVTQLQTFLVNQNYPGGGNWMITGNFKSATMQAVRNFQQSQGLPMTGVVDAATRAAISRVSCGTNGYNYNNYNNIYPSSFAQGYGGTQYNYTPPTYNYNNNTNYNTNCLYTYPYTCNNYNNNYGMITLSSLSVTSAPAGSSVTIYGTGFDYSNNTVYFGTTPLANIPSYNGTSISFTVPSYAAGVVSIYVANSRGQSNSLSFTVSSNPIVCQGYGQSQYQYGYGQGQYQYGYNYCPPNNGTPYITYLNPSSGAVGASVTVFGSGFGLQGNTVHFGNGIIANLMSFDATSVTFTVPSQLVGYGSQMVNLGAYNVSVSNSAGFTSNALPFTVTSLGSYGAPTITSVGGPTTLSTGTQGTWTIQLNNNQINSYVTTSVNWGDQNVYGTGLSPAQTTYAQGNQTLTFTHTYSTSGTYAITFTVSNQGGQQNTSTVTVIVSGSNAGSVVLNSISPTSGHVGTQIMLNGSGFNSLDNTVHFGVGGTLHVPSSNGTTIYYTIPYFVSPCDLVGVGCAAPAQQVLPGSYQIYVTNSAGTSQTLTFQVN